MNNKPNRYRDGHHVLSIYWQSFKITLPVFSEFIRSVIVGICLGDAGISKANKDASIKIEQGYKQYDFVLHLFNLFKEYCFITSIGERREPVGSPRAGLIKSYWFRTFAIPQITEFWNVFYVNGVKIITPGLITLYVDAIALTYWVIGDGSYNGYLILHTQSFTYDENLLISKELNAKFGLHSRVEQHKHKYYIVRFPASDNQKLAKIITPYMLECFSYKLPKA